MNEHRFPKWVWPSLLGLLGISPPAIALWFQSNLEQYLATQTPLQLIRLLIPLLGISTLLLAWCIYQHPWLCWDEPTGTWLNRLSKLRYCAKCKAAKIVTPLKNEVTGWRCMNCQHFFHDPSRADIESPKKKVVKNERI